VVAAEAPSGQPVREAVRVVEEVGAVLAVDGVDERLDEVRAAAGAGSRPPGWTSAASRASRCTVAYGSVLTGRSPMEVRDTPKASRLETLGAWLGVWTPPRDCDVPPPPRRALAIGAAALVALAVLVALVVAPAIDDGKRETAAREQAAAERGAAERRAQLEAEQRARTGRLAVASPRTRALALVETAIGRDAKARFGTAGEPAACDPAAGADPAASRVVYDCFATVREIRGAGEQEGARGSLAIPYRAALDFAAGRYAFCKTNPPPAEQAIPNPQDVVELPPACRR
jgi:hypothetical protein